MVLKEIVASEDVDISSTRLATTDTEMLVIIITFVIIFFSVKYFYSASAMWS